MEDTLIAITIGTFGFLLLTNIYFRIKTFRSFKKLEEAGVYFGKEHVFDPKRMQTEIIAKHPKQKDLIIQHVNSMKLSLHISTLSMVVLTICGATLMYYR